MRKLLILLATATLTACGGSSDSPDFIDNSPSACSNEGQKQFVLDGMRFWYLWNDRLPAQVDLSQYATPDDLLDFLKTFSPLGSDNLPVDKTFSFIDSAAAEQQFFDEGEFEGFGFRSRFVAQNDLRLYYVFEDGPAFVGGLRRGQQIVALNGRSIADIQAAEGVGAVFATSPLEFTMREPNGSEFTTTIAQGLVTIDAVPQYRIIDAGGGRNVGYMQMITFINPANPQLDTVFGDFRNAGVQEVIIDFRYNGGGLVSTAELLGDYLGGFVAQNLVFSNTEFNADRAADENDVEFFELRGNSIDLSRLVVIGGDLTASAPELVTNSMEPHVDVAIVGGATSGKPVGQLGLTFCDQVLRAVAFQITNASGEGGYFDGLPADCAVADDFAIPMGDPTDPNLTTALAYLDTGTCPTVRLPADVSTPSFKEPRLVDPRGWSPQREYLDAW